MNPPINDTTPTRARMRRLMPRREFRRLRAVGRARIGAGILLIVCGSLSATARSMSRCCQAVPAM